MIELGRSMQTELFESQVKDALAHFYDPAHLQTHPLTELLVADAEESLRAPSLRKLLMDSIDSLKPEAAIPRGRPEWLAYHILRQRYLEACSREEISQELGLSRSSFYRYHNEGISAVASILWNERQSPEAPAPAAPQASAVGTGDRAQEEAVRLARALQRDRVSIEEIVEGVRATMLPLAKRQSIRLSIEMIGAIGDMYGAPTILRQIAIGILSEAISWSAPADVACHVWEERGQVVWQIQARQAEADRVRALWSMRGIALGKELLEEYGGHLTIRQAERTTIITFSIPSARPKTLLVVDDDAETTHLYAQYLAGQDYTLVEVRTTEALHHYLAQAEPDAILLDVLMPGEDGWSIMQQLKLDPKTEHIPVVICSVLSQPELALALGADAVLQKPIGRETLLQTVSALIKP